MWCRNPVFIQCMRYTCCYLLCPTRFTGTKRRKSQRGLGLRTAHQQVSATAATPFRKIGTIVFHALLFCAPLDLVMSSQLSPLALNFVASKGIACSGRFSGPSAQPPCGSSSFEVQNLSSLGLDLILRLSCNDHVCLRARLCSDMVSLDCIASQTSR